MMKNCFQEGQLHNALKIFDHNPMSRDVVSWNTVIAGCVNNGEIHLAHQLFDKMPERDIVSWNTRLRLLQKSNDQQGIYHSFLQLHGSGLRPTNYTFSIVISSILGCIFNVLIPQLHAQIVSLGHNSSVFVGSALMRGYTNLGDHSALYCVFEDILEKDISVWNVLILGYMELGLTHEAERAFNTMPDKDVVSWTTMVDGYLKNKQVDSALYIFNRMDEKSVISWTAMISGYVRIGKYLEALELFLLMTRSRTRANQHTFSSILAACAGHSDFLAGRQVHASIVKHGTPVDVVLLTSLVNMYAKCGDIEAAYLIFETMNNKNLASWNSIIGGHARHGLARRALDEFEKMIGSGVSPNHITFVNVLSACVHGGLVEDGEKIFSCMEREYGVSPEKEHYACMVDLYGRAGYLEKAKQLIECMPFKPDVVVWGAFLGACGLHSDFEFSSNAAEAIQSLEKDNPAAYSVLSKILGENGVWSSLSELKIGMEDKRMKRQKAGSWIT